MRQTRNQVIILVGIGIAIALLITLFSPLASASPDGLEKVAENKAFIDSAKDAPYELIADYAFPWVENEDLATILAGAVGVFIVAGVAFGLAFGLQHLGRRSSSTNTEGDTSWESPP